MKKYFYWYHTLTNKWVSKKKRFDKNSFFVEVWNDDSLNYFHAKEEDLLNFKDYVFYILMGGDVHPIERRVLLEIYKSNGFIEIDSFCDDLQINRDNEFNDIISRLMIKRLIKPPINSYADLNTPGLDLVVNEVFIEITERGLSKIKRKDRKKKMGFLCSFLSLLFLLSASPTSISSYPENNEVLKIEGYYSMAEKRKQHIKGEDFSFDLLIEYMKLISMPNKDIVLSQIILETDWFRSDIFNENNNLFGMKKPRIRETTVVGTNRGHATYKHWSCSVDDYKLWYYFMTQNRNYDNYYHFLISVGYAEDLYYINKLKSIKNNIMV